MAKNIFGAAAARMDTLYEFDREPVSLDKLQSGAKFAGLFAGEHVAATEFVIGAFFVLHGVTAKDLLLGLAIGNLLAVLSWTFICAPDRRPDPADALLVPEEDRRPGRDLDLQHRQRRTLLHPGRGHDLGIGDGRRARVRARGRRPWTPCFPTSAGWVMLTTVIGALFTTLAILGFEKLSRFAQVCSPWIFLVFIAGAIAMLSRLGVERDLGEPLGGGDHPDLERTCRRPGQEKLGFWHILFFAWFCNLAMHIGLSDMAIFRYAKKWTYGLYSAFGMYPGHMLAWICSGIMVAAVGREMNPGPDGLRGRRAGRRRRGPARGLDDRQPDALPGGPGAPDPDSRTGRAGRSRWRPGP